MKLKKLILILISILILIIVIGTYHKSSNIIIDYDNSFYSEYWIKNDKVHIKCELLINNHTNKSAKIKLKGYFYDDVKSGLLKNAILDGYTANKNIPDFEIKSGKQKITVIFIGDFNETDRKHNRNLPKIKIIY